MNGKVNQFWLVRENLGFLPYPTGVPAPPRRAHPDFNGWIRYAELVPLSGHVEELGPHQHSLRSSLPVPGVPGYYFRPNGFSHVVYSDMSTAVCKHYKNINNEGPIVQGGATPDRVE